MRIDGAADVAWYAIWTRSRHEQVVREQLERKGYEAFLPTITRWSRWKDRKKQIDWPLFPGYCFARFDPASGCRSSSAPASSHRVVQRRARADPDHEIDSIRTLVESELQFDPCPLIKKA